MWLPREYDDASEEECVDGATEIGECIEEWEYYTIGHMCEEEILRRIQSN